MTKRNQRNKGGFTLVEVMVALALVLLLAFGLYGTGLMVMRMTHFNRVSIEARALGVQMLEDLASRSKTDVLLQVPFAIYTNYLMRGEEVVRTVRVTGHNSALATVTNLASSAYMEVRVDVRYVSPLTRSPVTNIFSTIVN